MSPGRLHCDFHFMVSVILELQGERLTLKNSCAGGPVGNSEFRNADVQSGRRGLGLP